MSKDKSKELFDKGINCRGKGFNCFDCKDKQICVEYENTNIDVKKKPPLGLMPNDIWKLKRLQEIKSAMGRYTGEDMEIPKEWIDEYIYLSRDLVK